MDLDQLRAFCLSLPEASEDMPFDDAVLAFRAMDKIFGLCNIQAEELSINLKCQPDYAEYLRERWAGDIVGGYHMNKKHWNTVYCERDELSADLLRDMILHSYQLIVLGMKKAERERILALAASAGIVFRLPPPISEWG
jgi:predicted DNA-binding protein (MmcQ/YjbR family)